MRLPITPVTISPQLIPIVIFYLIQFKKIKFQTLKAYLCLPLFFRHQHRPNSALSQLYPRRLGKYISYALRLFQANLLLILNNKPINNIRDNSQEIKLPQTAMYLSPTVSTL